MEPYKLDQILTKEEHDTYGWNTGIDPLSWSFTEDFIARLLVLACDDSHVISILADTPHYTIVPILCVMKRRYKSANAGDWRILQSGIVVIGHVIRRHISGPELPILFLEMLNELLKSKIKTLRESALRWTLIICALLEREFGVSKKGFIKSDMEQLGTIIDPANLKGVTDLRVYLNSREWHGVCETIAHLRWKYESIEPNFNTELMNKVLRGFWPKFSI